MKYSQVKKGIYIGLVTLSITFFGVTGAEARPQNVCAIPAGIPFVKGEYMMSFRYLLPREPEGIEIRGTREVIVNQCQNTLSVTIFQPGSIPEEVVFRAKINEFGDASFGGLRRINFGLTGGSPEDVIIRDMAIAMSNGGNFYGSGYLDNPELGDYDGSRVLFVFEPIEE